MMTVQDGEEITVGRRQANEPEVTNCRSVGTESTGYEEAGEISTMIISMTSGGIQLRPSPPIFTRQEERLTPG
jgi:hypothetical protein